MADSRRRVMWLLNHFTARAFEVPMLKKLGFTEVFLPKKFPLDVNYRSPSIDYSEDAGLTIPQADLAALNAVDWYGETSRDVWELASRHFDVLFFIPWGQSIFRSVANYFRGAAILRAYGLPDGKSYRFYIQMANGGKRCLESLGRRFWFGSGYAHLADGESSLLRERQLFLPVGLEDCRVRDDWQGGDSTILFVCPGVESNPYYAEVYREFQREFGKYPYAVGGSQPLASSDPHVLGFVSAERYERNKREFRVMFYHSTEPNQVHYTPFEGVRAGMPLVFMAGGLLDRLGGLGLPGRCRNYAEARAKIERILNNDRPFIEQIRSSQPRLLDALRPEVAEPTWRKGMARVVEELDRARSFGSRPSRRRKIGVMLPVAYRGGTLRSAKLLARALWIGSRQSGEDADVVFGYPETTGQLGEPWDSGLPAEITRRMLQWRELRADAALRAMRFAGNPDWRTPTDLRYVIPDDGIRQMCDCDLWVVISDRLSAHLLPIRRQCLVIYDYVQRYAAGSAPADEELFLAAARNADRVLVTTRFTEQDALNYAGVERSKLVRLPTIIPDFPFVRQAPAGEPYFLWSTNIGRHKNHVRAMTALKEYYERLDGRLDCRVTGIGNETLLSSELPHLKPLGALAAESEALRQRLRVLGELPETEYRRQLAGASFLWHPVRIDNGSLSVVEAATLGVPSLSSRYPAMEEMETEFGLHLTWMDAENPANMACQLKRMEHHASDARACLPCPEELARHSVENVARQYWKAMRECL